LLTAVSALGRCAITTTVLPCARMVRIARARASSPSASRLELGSSSTMRRGAPNTARARPSRWICPPAGEAESASGRVRLSRGTAALPEPLFAANLVLFAGLLGTALYLFTGNGEEAEGGAAGADAVAEDRPTLAGLAYLKGQMAALREHPATMPAFEEAWAREVCRKRLRRDIDFAEVSEDVIEGLVDDFYRGYAERFDDYYDTRHARRFGYEYGLRFDPAIHPEYGLARLRGRLAEHEKRLRSRYDLDRTQWILFKFAFYEGYRNGFLDTEEGVTAGAGEPLRLTFD